MTAPDHIEGRSDGRVVEKHFYLRELRGRTLIVALDGDPAPAGDVLDELLANQVRLIVVTPAEGAAHLLAGRPRVPVPTVDALDRHQLTRVWTVLRHARALVIPTDPRATLALASRLAGWVRPTKVVLARQGLTSAGLGSFLDDAQPLAGAVPDEVAEVVTLGRSMLATGVHTVNLCDPDRVGDELFTYQGAGTLLSHGGYLEVAPLGVDQYAEVEALIDGGVRDGFLRHRTPDELAQVLFDGFGASITGSGHLAGVVALESRSYAPEPVGELVSLITINRFGGQGVATALVERVVAEAARQGLTRLFTCTTSSSATAFFVANGFHTSTHDAIPATKWEHYDPQRRADVVVLMRELTR